MKSNNTNDISAKETNHQLLEEAKAEEKKKKEAEKKPELDTSFFTSSMSFGKKDFEDAKENMKKKPHKKWVKNIIIGILILLITAGVIFLVYTLIK